MKAQKLIENAYYDLGRLGASQVIEPFDSQMGIDTLNSIMAEYAFLNLGYTELTGGDDDITTPNWAWNWLRKKLALELATQGSDLERVPYIERQESAAYEIVLRSAKSIPAPTMTGNVPLGQGNRTTTYGWQSPFYKESDDGILSEQNAVIVTEDA